ncbi:MAG: nuclear transport factor 2 family protein [Sphingomonadales bacterium]
MRHTKARAHELFQLTYYDSIDRGDIPGAVSALHPDVVWWHAQVWKRHEFGLPASERLEGKSAVEALLGGLRDNLGKAGIRHRIRDMAFDPETGKGAFLGAVVGSDGAEAPFLAWFELEDDLIRRYTIRPL